MGKDSLLSYNRFRESSAWIILILGMLLYYISYFHIEQPSVWKEILIKIGDVLVIGVILGYLSNAAQFLGIFKQDLQDIYNPQIEMFARFKMKSSFHKTKRII